ncbi:MAG: M1 family metallopeptidase, partial [Burkholderiaceae bacterium]|nr:M1 family metallopeptidase [Burkholderiaceae bacterium]
MSLISASLKGLAVASLLAAGFAIHAAGEGGAPAAAVNPPAGPASPSLDGIPIVGRMARAVTVPSAPNAWGGPRSGNEPTLSDRVVNYDIAATLDPEKHTVDGQEKLTWRNRSDKEVRAVYLHLYLNAFEGNGSTMYNEQNHNGFEFRTNVKIKDGEWGHMDLGKVSQGGSDVKWTYVHPDDGPATDHTVVRFDLPTAVAPGASTTLDIAFHDQLPRVVARSGYFGTFHLIGQWYPKIGVLELPGERGATEVRWNAHEYHAFSEFYADFGNFDVKMTVPKGYTVGATGEEQGAPVEAGDKVTYRYVQGDVHDFAWTADNRTAKPLEGTYTGEGSPTVKVKVLYPPEYEATAAPSLKATIDALAYFSKTLGPYPYKTVTVVVPPYNAAEAGGMEYPTFFTADGFDKVDPNSLDQYMVDFVNIHEFGHGYFYGILASNEFEEPMLDEGMNDYWDYHMLRAADYKIHVIPRPFNKLGLEFDADPFDLERL